MTWTLTAATAADRDLVVDTLRKEAERRDKAASSSALQLVTSTDDGRISTRSAKAVRQLHEDAETLRSLAWELEHQPTLPAAVEASEVLEEERAATYPAPALVEVLKVEAEHADTTRDADIDYTRAKPRTAKVKARPVKLVEFTEEDELAAAKAAHPSNRANLKENQ